MRRKSTDQLPTVQGMQSGVPAKFQPTARLQKKLVAMGWNELKLQEAQIVALDAERRFSYVARLHNTSGIPLALIPDVLSAQDEFSDVGAPTLWKVLQLCSDAPEDEEEHVFFSEFMSGVNILQELAVLHFSHRWLATNRAFILSRLLRYIKISREGDIEQVYHEILENPYDLLECILYSGGRARESKGEWREVPPHPKEEEDASGRSLIAEDEEGIR